MPINLPIGASPRTAIGAYNSYPSVGNGAVVKNGFSYELGLMNNPAMKEAYGNLIGILRSQGRTDPRILATEQSKIANTTQSKQQAITAGAAQGGLGDSGLVQAINAATAVGGAGSMVDAATKSAAEAEQRKREGLQSVMDLIVNPNIQLGEVMAAQKEYDRQKKAQDKQAMIGNISAGIGTILSVVGLFMCWTAREIFGPEDDRWQYARHYLIYMADDKTRMAYMKEGEALARAVKEDPALRAELTPVFEKFSELGRQDLENVNA